MSKKLSNTPRSTGRVLTLVSLISAAFGASAQTAPSQYPQVLSPVVVSASRFPNDPAFAPIGATVITADQIRQAGVTNVNEAVRKIGGVHGRQSTRGGADHPLDMRGFGVFGDQNIVVLIDGIRISEYEQAQALMSSIPIDSVERIEVVRGGSSVLYGSGATGGTIQIVTKRSLPNQSRGTATISAGSYGAKGATAFVSRGWDNFALDASLSATNDDNYRDNNEARQRNFSSGLEWFSPDTRLRARIDTAEQDNRFPGALDYARYVQNPRQADTPNNYGYSDMTRYTLAAERRVGEFDFAIELAHREQDYGAFLGANLDYHSRNTQLSPRVRHLTASSTFTNEFVVGLDLAKTHRTTDVPAFSTYEEADQRSRGWYARNEVKFGPARIAAGVRHENFDIETTNIDPFSASYTKKHSLNAWEVQGSYDMYEGFQIFATAGRSYRIANPDDNALTEFQNQPLEPQVSKDFEVGASVRNAGHDFKATLFRHSIKNEIMFDPTAGPFGFGANLNLDPTRRQGIEIEMQNRLGSQFVSTVNYQYVSAKFSEGPNAGREMVLVPRNKVTARLTWLPASSQSADVGLQWVDSQRFGGDFANACTARIPSYATLDARYAKRVGPWEFAVAGTNLTDRDYFSNAFGACQSGIYPDAGRQLKFSVRRDF